MNRHLASFLTIVVFALLAGASGSAPRPSTESGTPASSEPAAVPEARLPDLLRMNIASLKKLTDAPASTDAILVRVALFGAMAKFVADAEHQSSDDVKKLGLQLKRDLSRVQAQQLPRLRKAWAEHADQKMWEHNVDVRAFGPGNQTLELVGGVFASNKNIKEIQGSLTDAVRALRFRRVQYRWYKGADEYTYYTLNTPADSVVTAAID